MNQHNDSAPKSGPTDTGMDEPTQLTDEEIAAEIAGGDDQLEAARQEIATLNDRLLRLAAELENTRRRAEREKVDASRYAIANFARDLIGVADNFERAVRVASGRDDEASAAVVTSLIDGLQMTEKELLAVLERHGVRRIAAERQKFDPNMHQAVAQIPHADIPSGHVVDVAQAGFSIGDRVLRAAMVTVSSGPGAPSGETPSGERLDTKV